MIAPQCKATFCKRVSTFSSIFLAMIFSYCYMTSAYAQTTDDFDDGPIILNAKRDHLTKFGINQIHTAVDLLYRHRVDKRVPNKGTAVSDVENELTETLDLNGKAFILHPNFVDITFTTRFQLDQTSLTSEAIGQSGVTNQTIVDYDLSATLFPKEKNSLTLFSRRSQVIVERQFSGSLDNITTVNGVMLNLGMTNWTHRFRLSRRQEEQNSTFGNSDVKSSQWDFDWNSLLTLSPYHRIQFDYNFESINEQGQSNNQYQRHDLNINESLHFGQDKENELQSILNVVSQIGDFASNRIRLDESLRLKHSNTFRTQYDYRYTTEEFSTSLQVQHNGQFFFEHRLYKSLTTSGLININRLTFADDATGNATSNEWTAELNFDYLKNVPFGRLSLDLRLNHNEQDNSTRGGAVTIRKDPYVFADTGLVIINHRNIEAASVVVHNAEAFGVPLLFTENIHYTVTVFPDRIELKRIDGVAGGIGNPHKIEVDYNIGPEPANTTSTNTVGFSIRYDIDQGLLRGMGIYARYLSVGQSIDGGNATLVPNAIDDLTIGIDYRIWELYFNVEHQIHDSSISPFIASLFETRFYHRFSSANTIGSRLAYTDTQFTDSTQSHTTLFTASGNSTWQLTSKLSFTVEVEWRQTTDSIGINSDAFDQDMEIRWNYRQTRVYCRVKNTLFSSDTTTNTYQIIEVGLRREF